jgi:hypothetical protein
LNTDSQKIAQNEAVSESDIKIFSSFVSSFVRLKLFGIIGNVG